MWYARENSKLFSMAFLKGWPFPDDITKQFQKHNKIEFCSSNLANTAFIGYCNWSLSRGPATLCAVVMPSVLMFDYGEFLYVYESVGAVLDIFNKLCCEIVGENRVFIITFFGEIVKKSSFHTNIYCRRPHCILHLHKGRKRCMQKSSLM